MKYKSNQVTCKVSDFSTQILTINLPSVFFFLLAVAQRNTQNVVSQSKILTFIMATDKTLI